MMPPPSTQQAAPMILCEHCGAPMLLTKVPNTNAYKTCCQMLQCAAYVAPGSYAGVARTTSPICVNCLHTKCQCTNCVCNGALVPPGATCKNCGRTAPSPSFAGVPVVAPPSASAPPPGGVKAPPIPHTMGPTYSNMSSKPVTPIHDESTWVSEWDLLEDV